jgi:hypothetical protein
MKYEITQDRLDKIIFRYLDMEYGNLEKVKAKHVDVDIVFKKPNSDSDYGIMGWEKSGMLYIYYKLIKEISSVFSIKEIDSKEVIGRWVEDKYQIDVNHTQTGVGLASNSVLKININ